MHINTKMRLAALLYLMAAYAVALPGLALFTDLMINGGIIDMWKGAYSFMDLLARRKILYLQFAGLGAILGFVYWLFFFRKYRHHDPSINILSSARHDVLIMPGQRMMKSEPEASRIPYIPFAGHLSAASRLPALCQGSI
ncbi:outer membrane protein [Klebsiella michiganensis]|nr:outer membrane protein [Klebsiella michiganensis]